LKAFEVNFDGLVGPTHNYAGLSFGNVASQAHGGSVSRPREAALQGLAKMKFLADLGVRQAVLPPHPRPDLAALRRLGFGGSDADVLWKASREEPRLLAAVYSSSAMWAANAATVSPSADSEDGRVHFTPANLIAQFHRSIEASYTSSFLRWIFSGGSTFVHHEPLPATESFADEGAANHMRLSASHGEPGAEVFVFGRSASGGTRPSKYPARQTREACAAIARSHRLDPSRCVFLQQNPAAVDAGAFHNDVVAVANERVLLCHASAFAGSDEVFAEIRNRLPFAPAIIAASDAELSLADAVQSYVFNSQLVTLPGGSMALIAPAECRENQKVQAFLQRVLAGDNPIRAVHYLDVRQSMCNGGGPACLRLRVVLTEEQLRAVHPGVMFDDELYAKLVAWVQTHYRETLRFDDLVNPSFLEESREAVTGVAKILGINMGGDGPRR
jgi:succinylarginine dihydrolase